MGKLILKGYVLTTDQDLPIIKAELPRHIEQTLQEAGCITFEICQDLENLNRFNVYEAIIDMASFEAHQARAWASSWGAASAHLEKHYHIMGGFNARETNG